MVHDSLDLLNGRTEALFRVADGRMTVVNEPWEAEKPAPRAFLGATLDGRKAAWFRNDVADEAVARVTALFQAAPAVAPGDCAPANAGAYLAALGADKFTFEWCYRVDEDALPAGSACASIDGRNATALSGAWFDWLPPEVDFEQPCMAVMRGGAIASLCRSVRRHGAIHEAGIETHPAHRGQGLALIALGGWARAVWDLGGVALYSHRGDNGASRRVAEKAGLVRYGACIEIL